MSCLLGVPCRGHHMPRTTRSGRGVPKVELTAAATSARPAVITMPVDCTTPERPAAKAKGTVSPSGIPMTTSRIVSEEMKCFSTCGVCGMPLPVISHWESWDLRS
jgi:hypothetical protein